MKQVITTSLVFTGGDVLDMIRQLYDGVPEDAEVRVAHKATEDGTPELEIIVTFTKEDAQ